VGEIDTLPTSLRTTAKRFGQTSTAMRQKDRGIWRSFTWEESFEQIRDLSLGLTRMGFQRGDKACIIGDNDPQYFWAQLAIQSVGGVAVGIFTDSSPIEIEYIGTHSDATLVFAKDQEQCDKLIEIKDQIPNVKRVIYWDEKGLWSYDDDWLLDYAKVQEIGRRLQKEQPTLFDELVDAGKADDLAIFCYTSGTTGQPKGAMISHANLIDGCDLTLEVDPRTEDDEYLSFLPPAWITENVLGLTIHLRTGMIVNFPEAPETVQENLREITPFVQLFSARQWESLVALVQMKMTEATWINRMLYRLFMPVGYKVANLRYEQHKTIPWIWRVLFAFGEITIFHPLRDKLGMTRIRSAYSSGAALSPDVIRFFRAIGVNIKQLYGSTEAQTHTLHIGDDVRFETVGVPLPGMDVRIADDGEILIAGPSVFKGYYKDPEATQAALEIDSEGKRWFRTGDAGHIDDDQHVIYLDRLKEMIPLSSGEHFSPQFIEGQLKFSPYIRDAMTVGAADLPFVTALINIDFENVGRWAERQGLAYTTFVDLSQKPEIYRLIRQDVQRVNRTLVEAAAVRRFVLMHKEFDPDEAELTRTRKLRRRTLREHNKEIIDAMYSDNTEVSVKASVRYQDGRESVIETTVHVETLEKEEKPV
jgi:long-chain acyl-CoA synthetase